MAVIAALMLGACGGGNARLPAGPEGSDVLDPPVRQGAPTDDAGTCSPTWSSLQRDVFAPSCVNAGCHGAEASAAGLDLTIADPTPLFGRAANACAGAVIDPGSPDSSLLVRKLMAPPDAACGDAMPPGGVSLDAERVACVRAFVESLSPDAAVALPGDCERCGGSTCVAFDSDAAHCGACDSACPSGATCIAGQCDCGDLATCASGCAELSTDPSNCGACGVTCGPGKLCTPTGCGTAADCAGLTQCGSACVDTNTSLTHCGACDHACSPGESCTEGTCACPGGGTSCGSGCVDTQTDEANCGACGKACAPGQQCEAGACTCGSEAVDFAQVADILDARCTNAGCHVGARAKEGLDLSAAKSFAEMVGVKASQCSDGRLLVDPYAPGQSYLIQKLTGVDMCSGSIMPKADATLADPEVALISTWICQGATP